MVAIVASLLPSSTRINSQSARVCSRIDRIIGRIVLSRLRTGAITETSGASEVVTRGILDGAAKCVKPVVNGRARYTSNGSMKPRILVIPNASSWILGDIARQVIAAHGHRFEFRYLSELTARARPDRLRRLAAEVDLIHALTEVIAARIWEVIDTATPVVTWIHHICEWRPEHQHAVARSAHIVASTEGWRDAILEWA